MKTKWLVANVIGVGSRDRAERAVLEGALFCPIQAVFVVGEPLCDVGTPS